MKGGFSPGAESKPLIKPPSTARYGYDKRINTDGNDAEEQSPFMKNKRTPGSNVIVDATLMPKSSVLMYYVLVGILLVITVATISYFRFSTYSENPILDSNKYRQKSTAYPDIYPVNMTRGDPFPYASHMVKDAPVHTEAVCVLKTQLQSKCRYK